MQHSVHTHPAHNYTPAKGYKLPHGLTVRELKDMTSARLAAEARQKDVMTTDTKGGHAPGLFHSASSVSSTHSNRSRNSVLERPSLDEISASHNLISSHVQKFQGVSNGRHSSASNLQAHSSTGFAPPPNNRGFSDFHRANEHSMNEWNHRNHPVESQIHHPSSSNEYYMSHDISRSHSYPMPSALLNQSFSFSGTTSIHESHGTFIPLTRSSVEAEYASHTRGPSEKNHFVPVVTYGESYLAGSSVASRGSSPTDSKTDDRSSFITESGWFDIFGRPSSAATIPTIVPSSESFCPDDDTYTLNFSPEHIKSSHALPLDEREMVSFSPHTQAVPMNNFHIRDGGDWSNPNNNNGMPMSGVFRSLPLDRHEGRPASFYPLSPLRNGSDVANDSSFVKSWTYSFAEDEEDLEPNEETDEFPLNRLEDDLNALLTISHEPGMLEKNDFLVSKIDPVFCSTMTTQTPSVIGIPPPPLPPTSTCLHEEEKVPSNKSRDPLRRTAPSKGSNSRRSVGSHRHRNGKKKDHAFNS